MDIIDFHVHLPWNPHSVREASSILLRELDNASVKLAVVINVEFGIETFKSNVSSKSIIEAGLEVFDYIFDYKFRFIERFIGDPERTIREHVEFMEKNNRDSELFVEGLSGLDRLIPVVSYNPDIGVEANYDRLRRLSNKILGLKIFPTLHFTRPDSTGLSKLYSLIGSIGGVVIIHTGCDPGIWELPAFCRTSRPSIVAKIAKAYRDVVFIVAHLGSYSALKPGIYFDEAIEALSIDNVYADTSAVEPYFIEKAVEEVGYDKILFGSDYPVVLGLTLKDAISGIMSLGIPGNAKRAILYDNAVKILRNWNGWSRVERIISNHSSGNGSS
ncbi:MAG: amidohydrolase family protein [Acidilobaceae archaeon]